MIRLSKGYWRCFIILEVQVNSEGIFVDDFVIDKSLDKSWVWISCKWGKRKSNESLRIFKIFRCIVSNKNVFFESMFSKIDGSFFKISVESSIKIRNWVLLIIFLANGASIFMIRLSFWILTFDENIARTCINI